MKGSLRLLTLGAVSAIGIGIWRAPETIASPAADSLPARVAVPAPKLVVSASSTPLAPAPAPSRPQSPVAAAAPDPAAPPAGVGAGQWAALRVEYADRPQELKRLADHFAFSDRLDRFRSKRSGGSDAEQLSLARSLDGDLDERLRERELGAAEARLIKLAVLEVLVDDDAQRREALARWEASLAPPTPDAARAAVAADFQQRQAAIVAAWRALPADRRDPRALERELQAQRVRSFDAQPPNGGQR